MPQLAGQVPILKTLNAAAAFQRDHARAILPWALALAVLSTMISMVAPSFMGGSPPPAMGLALFPLSAVMSLVALPALGSPIDPLAACMLVTASSVAAIGYWAFLLRRAVGMTDNAALGQDWARLARVFGAIWFLVLILTIAAAIVMGALLGGAMGAAGITPAELEAAQGDPFKATALVQQAMAGTSGLVVWLGLGLFGAGAAWLFARLALAGPATIIEAKATAFGTWSYTKGDGLRIAAIYAAILAPVIALMILAQSLAPDAASLNSQAGIDAAVASAPILLGANAAIILMQTLVAMPMMAGAGAFLHRGMKPPGS